MTICKLPYKGILYCKGNCYINGLIISMFIFMDMNI